MQLSQDLGHRPLVMLRFNPDAYVAMDGQRVTSCWAPNKRGIVALKKKKKVEWLQRLATLTEQIAYWTQNSTDKMLEVVHLYYD